MNAFQLLKALELYLQPQLAQLPLAVRSRENNAKPAPLVEAKNGVEFEQEEMRPCAIYIGSMPPTTNEALSAAPFMVIQAMDGDDNGDGLQTIRVALRLCVVGSNSESGEADLLTLLSHTRLALMKLPGGSLQQFRLVPFGELTSRLPWERPDEQVHPFLQAHILTQWQTAGANKEWNAGMIDYE